MRRPSVVCIALVLFGAAAGLSAAQPAIAQTAGNPPSTGTTMPSDIDPQSGFRLPLPKREDLDEAGQKAYDRGTTPGATIAGLQGPAGIQLFSPKTAATCHRAQPLSALRGGLHAARPRGRDPDHRARDGQPVRMGRARARGAQGRRAAEHHRRHQAPAQHRRPRRDRRAHHRARPPALARPQGEVGNLRQAQGASSGRTS